MREYRWDKRRAQKAKRKWYRFDIFDFVLLLSIIIYIRILFHGLWICNAIFNLLAYDGNGELYSSKFIASYPNPSQTFLTDLENLVILLWVLWALTLWSKIRQKRQSLWAVLCLAIIFGAGIWYFGALVKGLGQMPYNGIAV